MKSTDTRQPMDLSRRESVKVIAACAFCVAAGPASRPAATQRARTHLDAGNLADFAADGVYDRFARSDRVLIVRNGDRLYATSSECTHRSCVLKRDVDGIQHLRCPCHGSTFDLDGIPIDGEASEPLPRFAIRVDSGRVKVDLTKVFGEREWESADAYVAVSK